MVRSVARPRRTGYRRVTRRKKQWRKRDTLVTPSGLEWNEKQTTDRNYAEMGLAMKLSHDKKIQHEATHGHGDVDLVRAVRDLIRDEPSVTSLRKSKHHLDEHERRYLVQLRSKHGHDYAKMFRDMKLNYLQKTRGQLEKRIERLEKLEAEEAAVDSTPAAAPANLGSQASANSIELSQEVVLSHPPSGRSVAEERSAPGSSGGKQKKGKARRRRSTGAE